MHDGCRALHCAIAHVLDGDDEREDPEVRQLSRAWPWSSMHVSSLRKFDGRNSFSTSMTPWLTHRLNVRKHACRPMWRGKHALHIVMVQTASRRANREPIDSEPVAMSCT